MRLRASVDARLARQLRHPGGLAGRLVGPLLDRRNRRSITAAVDALAPPAGATVADIGFGGGVGIQTLLDRVGAAGTVHGVEISAAMLDRASRRFRRALADRRLVLHAAPATELPFADRSLDGAITINTIYFIADLDGAFAELARALRPGGHAVVGLADPEWMRRLPPTAYGFRLRPVDEVRATLARVGLSVEHRTVPKSTHPYHLLVVGRAPVT